MKVKILLILVFILLGYYGYAQTHPLNQMVTKAEYFVDTDPGVGKGTSITGTYNQQDVTVNLDRERQDLNHGVHLVSFCSLRAPSSWLRR